MSPCGVRMTPARPSRPGSSASMLKDGFTTTCIQSAAGAQANFSQYSRPEVGSPPYSVGRSADLDGPRQQKENTGEAWVRGRRRRRGDCHRRSGRLFVGEEVRDQRRYVVGCRSGGQEHCHDRRQGPGRAGHGRLQHDGRERQHRDRRRHDWYRRGRRHGRQPDRSFGRPRQRQRRHAGFQENAGQGEAKAEKDGSTYKISGTAVGVDMANPMQPAEQALRNRGHLPVVGYRLSHSGGVPWGAAVLTLKRARCSRPPTAAAARSARGTVR